MSTPMTEVSRSDVDDTPTGAAAPLRDIRSAWRIWAETVSPRHGGNARLLAGGLFVAASAGALVGGGALGGGEAHANELLPGGATGAVVADVQTPVADPAVGDPAQPGGPTTGPTTFAVLTPGRLQPVSDPVAIQPGPAATGPVAAAAAGTASAQPDLQPLPGNMDGPEAMDGVAQQTAGLGEQIIHGYQDRAILIRDLNPVGDQRYVNAAHDVDMANLGADVANGALSLVQDDGDARGLTYMATNWLPPGDMLGMGSVGAAGFNAVSAEALGGLFNGELSGTDIAAAGVRAVTMEGLSTIGTNMGLTNHANWGVSGFTNGAIGGAGNVMYNLVAGEPITFDTFAYPVVHNVATSGITNVATGALGSVAGTALGAFGGSAITDLILTGKIDVPKAVGTTLGALVGGPIGALVGGLLGGLFNKAPESGSSEHEKYLRQTMHLESWPLSEMMSHIAAGTAINDVAHAPYAFTGALKGMQADLRPEVAAAYDQIAAFLPPSPYASAEATNLYDWSNAVTLLNALDPENALHAVPTGEAGAELAEHLSTRALWTELRDAGVLSPDDQINVVQEAMRTLGSPILKQTSLDRDPDGGDRPYVSGEKGIQGGQERAAAAGDENANWRDAAFGSVSDADMGESGIQGMMARQRAKQSGLANQVAGNVNNPAAYTSAEPEQREYFTEDGTVITRAEALQRRAGNGNVPPELRAAAEAELASLTFGITEAQVVMDLFAPHVLAVAKGAQGSLHPGLASMGIDPASIAVDPATAAQSARAQRARDGHAPHDEAWLTPESLAAVKQLRVQMGVSSWDDQLRTMAAPTGQARVAGWVDPMTAGSWHDDDSGALPVAQAASTGQAGGLWGKWYQSVAVIPQEKVLPLEQSQYYWANVVNPETGTPYTEKGDEQQYFENVVSPFVVSYDEGQEGAAEYNQQVAAAKVQGNEMVDEGRYQNWVTGQTAAFWQSLGYQFA